MDPPGFKLLQFSQKADMLVRVDPFNRNQWGVSDEVKNVSVFPFLEERVFRPNSSHCTWLHFTPSVSPVIP